MVGLASACQVTPPPATFAGSIGRVRAAAPAHAREVSAMLDELLPEVLAVLPDSREGPLEIWVQDEPALYLFEGPAYAEADGFYSASHRRIHLRQNARSLRRTLAHELTHASLGPTWNRLPGSLEEGLCDLVSISLVPEEASSMRAGRFAAAAFATGGLELEVGVHLPQEASAREIDIRTSCQVRLLGDVSPTLAPARVFDVAAGLSTSRLSANDKKALYGLSLLLVERIASRVGIEGLHGLCLRAEREDLDKVPREWLLEAADLDCSDPQAWHRAIHASLGQEELRTILLLYPALLLDTAERLFGGTCSVGIDLSGTSPLRASVALFWSEAELELGLSLTLQGKNSPAREDLAPLARR